MTDRPILFSAPMVRALLDGRKTQTRRVLKPQPGPCTHKPYDGGTAEFQPSIDDDGLHCAECGNGLQIANTKSGVRGIPVRFRKGDRLYVRETWSAEHLWVSTKPRDIPCGPIWYWADGNPTDGDWTKPKPGIHMPRWVSRLTLTVTDVRVQRLQQISEADCIAEGPPELREMRGLGRPLDGVMVVDPAQPHVGMAPRTWYRELWDAINGLGAWDADPWIVALTFTVERRNIDAIPLHYLIWSNFHHAWWRPNHAGYCADLSEAGRYTREEAIKQCAYGRDGFTTGRVPPELPVREIDAINRRGRAIDDLVLKADRAECRARDLASKVKVQA